MKNKTAKKAWWTQINGVEVNEGVNKAPMSEMKFVFIKKTWSQRQMLDNIENTHTRHAQLHYTLGYWGVNLTDCSGYARLHGWRCEGEGSRWEGTGGGRTYGEGRGKILHVCTLLQKTIFLASSYWHDSDHICHVFGWNPHNQCAKSCKYLLVGILIELQLYK